MEAKLNVGGSYQVPVTFHFSCFEIETLLGNERIPLFQEVLQWSRNLLSKNPLIIYCGIILLKDLKVFV